MDINVSMYIFRESKQKALEDACNAFRLTEKMTEIANNIGVSPTTLRNKLNPEPPLETDFDEELEQLREHADHSCWKGFCELAFKVKRVIGIIVKTFSEEFSLVKKKAEKRHALRRSLTLDSMCLVGASFLSHFSSIEYAL